MDAEPLRSQRQSRTCAQSSASTRWMSSALRCSCEFHGRGGSVKIESKGWMIKWTLRGSVLGCIDAKLRLKLLTASYDFLKYWISEYLKFVHFSLICKTRKSFFSLGRIEQPESVFYCEQPRTAPDGRRCGVASSFGKKVLMQLIDLRRAHFLLVPFRSK